MNDFIHPGNSNSTKSLEKHVSILTTFLPEQIALEIDQFAKSHPQLSRKSYNCKLTFHFDDCGYSVNNFCSAP